MGFALPSHGDLPLERYIGSCLISSCPRSTSAPQQFSPPPLSLQPRKFQKQFYSSKIAFRSFNGSALRVSDQSVSKHANGKVNGVKFHVDRACFPHGAYDGPQKPNQIKQNPFKEPAVASGIVDETVWTIGVPLIAVQPPSFMNGSRSKNNRFRKNRKYDFGPTSLVADNSEFRMLHNNRSQFSKLAVHTQGVPLIQSSRYEQNTRPRNNKALCTSNSYNQVYRSNNSIPENSTSKNSSKVSSPQSDKKESPNPVAKINECFGVNSDENLSCNSLENSLPRIIKPRKRRKKDRKPNANTNVEPRRHDDNNNTPKENGSTCKERIGSVKTSLEKEKPSDDGANKKTVLVDEKDSQNSSLISKAVKFLLSEEQNALDHSSVASLENFDEILTRDESESAENVSVSCQCRYCDPSSVIWNVNTRGYSPSLVSCVLPFHENHSDPFGSFPYRSSGPVSAELSLARVSSPPNLDSHRAKYSPFNRVSPVSACNIRHSKLPPFPVPPPFESSPNHNCRFPPPNFLRPPNSKPFRHHFPLHARPLPNTAPMVSSHPRAANLSNNSDTNSKEHELRLSESQFSPRNDRISTASSFSDSQNKTVTCAEPFSSMRRGKPLDEFPASSDFTQRFGFLNVSNLHSVPTTNFIDTSRPPPPIPTKREEPLPQISDRASVGSPSLNPRKDHPWENQGISGGVSAFSNFGGGEKSSEIPQTHFSCIGQPFKEQKPMNHWPLFKEEFYAPLKAGNEPPCTESVQLSDISSKRDLLKTSEVPRTGSQNLEISSEIITSPNGHRDIEIKFFLTSSSTSPMSKSAVKSPYFTSAPELSQTLENGS